MLDEARVDYNMKQATCSGVNKRQHLPSFTMAALPLYVFSKNNPKPCVSSSKLHSVRESPNRTNSGRFAVLPTIVLLRLFHELS